MSSVLNRVGIKMKTKLTLADALRSARESRGLTLRDIELLSEGEISNAYVSQLELGHVTEPHPVKLKVLARVYKMDLLTLYRLAGYLPEKKAGV